MTDFAQCLAQMRLNAPLVQNITNYVAMNVMANVLLASGASPAMVHAREEASEFAGIADALTINIGTASSHWAVSMEEAATAARAHGKPWVLDPVAVGATRFRRELGARLLAASPTIVRGNASEIMALAGATSTGRGADAADPVAEAEAAARDLAARHDAVVAVTGPLDYVTDGARSARISNGHPTMPLVTALGCSLTGIVAAFSVAQDSFDATVSALAYFGAAGEIAGDRSEGPGSFQVAFLDALHVMSPADLAARAKVKAA